MRAEVFRAFFLTLIVGALGFYNRYYDSTDFTDIFKKHILQEGCHYYSYESPSGRVSIRTHSCVMVYESKDGCYGNYVKITPNRPVANLQRMLKFDNPKPFPSLDHTIFIYIRTCNQTETTGPVTVDFFGKEHYQVLMHDFTDVCECTQFPEHSHGKTKSIDNHGNCLVAYYTTDCTGKSADLHGGLNAFTENLNRWGEFTMTMMKSFRPCDIPEHCPRLKLTAFKFEIAPLISIDHIDRAAPTERTIFRNNGSATMSRHYSIRKSVQESYQIRESATKAYIMNVTMEDSAAVEVSNSLTLEASGIGFAARNRLTESVFETLKKVYSSSTNQNITYINLIYTEMREFSISEQIEISSCTEYEASSSVVMLKDIEGYYFAHCKVSGIFDGRNLTAQELRNKIYGMIYVEDYDQWTIVTKVKGEMKATLGIEAIMDGDEYHIQNCQTGSTIPDSQTGSSSRQDYIYMYIGGLQFFLYFFWLSADVFGN